MPITASDAEKRAFAKRLHENMTRKGLSASDVARAIWGTTTDGRGQTVARNRERISYYLKGVRLPNAKMIREMATLFGIQPSELYPKGSLSPAERNPATEASLAVVAEKPETALLRVDKIVSTAVGLEILRLLNK